MSPRFSAILFDLDGTIVDSAPASPRRLVHTRPPGAAVQSPPSAAVVGRRSSTASPRLRPPRRGRAALRLAIYRDKYAAEGVFDATAYPGVLDVIRAVHAAGVPLSLATSKPESLARLILEDLDVADCFTEISRRQRRRGAQQEGGCRGGGPAPPAAADGADLSNVVMVGDRIHDVEGAAAHGVPTIFVSWGYGHPRGGRRGAADRGDGRAAAQPNSASSGRCAPQRARVQRREAGRGRHDQRAQRRLGRAHEPLGEHSEVVVVRSHATS